MKYNLYAELKGVIAEQVAFLSRALAKYEAHRAMLSHISVEKKDPENPESALLAVATDGRRMHIVDPLGEAATAIYGMTPGLYKVVSSTKKRTAIARLDDESAKDIRYPNWKRSLPEGAPEKEAVFYGVNKKDGGASYREMIRFFRMLPEGSFLNFDYLNDLGDDHWNCQCYKNVCVFNNTPLKAVIMMIWDC